MVPVDGAWTLNQDDMITVLQQIKPKIAVPMHVFTQATLDKFLARAAEFYTVRRAAKPPAVLTRGGLPANPPVLFFPPPSKTPPPLQLLSPIQDPPAPPTAPR